VCQKTEWRQSAGQAPCRGRRQRCRDGRAGGFAPWGGRGARRRCWGPASRAHSRPPIRRLHVSLRGGGGRVGARRRSDGCEAGVARARLAPVGCRCRRRLALLLLGPHGGSAPARGSTSRRRINTAVRPAAAAAPPWPTRPVPRRQHFCARRRFDGHRG